MNITDKNTLKSWFLRGMKPLETQFAAWIDAYWHKSEQIPTSSINGLEATLNSKAEAADIRNLTNEFAIHRDDNTRHKTPEEQAKLGNLADNANFTYATKEELREMKDKAVIIIPVDFSLNRREIEASIANFVTPFFADKSIFSTPVFLLYSWKEDYTTPDAPAFQSLIHCTKETRELFDEKEYVTFDFNSSIRIPNVDNPKKSSNYCCSIRCSNEDVRVTMFPYKHEIVENLCLTENGDGMLFSKDKNWQNLYNELKKDNHPQISLKTAQSGTYCPASYEFFPIDPLESPIRYEGKIEISYLHQTDGVTELWVESRVFDKTKKFGGTGSAYKTPVDIKKYPVEDLCHLSADLQAQREAMDEMRNDLDAKINKHIKNVTYDTASATFTFTFEDGTTTTIDIPIENTVKNGHFDALANELVLTLTSDEEIRIPAARLAFKDSVNLSATSSATALTITNDCGTSAVIPAATTTAAGTMTADDRVKMTQLFNGAMLDSRNPQGYHRHNYLEMQDLPPIISLPAANYQEFKNAIVKLQPEIAKGKYGEIVQTGDWTINDNKIYDLTGITIVRQDGSIVTTFGPLRVLTRTNKLLLNDLYFYGREEFNSASIENVKSLYIKTIVATDIFINNATFFYTRGQNIEIDNGNSVANLIMDKYRNGVSGLHIAEPLRVKYLNLAYPYIIMKNHMPTAVENSQVEVVYNGYTQTPSFFTDGSCNFINLKSPAKVTVLQANFTDSNPAGLVPAPAAAQKNQYHVLNALGEWVDIRTLTSGV